MIVSYKCKETQKLKAEGSSRKFRSIERVALRKLDMLEAVVNLQTLRIPPSNHFEALHGDREGQYSIRINRQWRISTVCGVVSRLNSCKLFVLTL